MMAFLGFYLWIVKVVKLDMRKWRVFTKPVTYDVNHGYSMIMKRTAMPSVNNCSVCANSWRLCHHLSRYCQCGVVCVLVFSYINNWLLVSISSSSTCQGQHLTPQPVWMI